MNTANTPSHEMAADRFARRVTARLSSGANDLPYDISERLRAARMQALAKRKVTVQVRRVAPAVVHSGHAAALGGGSERGGWWNALISAVPVMALLVGLVVINVAQDELGTIEVAEVDAALLTDELPPAAYSDPGFVQFLKTAHSSN
ncbi:DUF3619 family protein [Acidovorax sp. JHL-9]|uniref:DUF3619 family protein n=1 Tax=Acidovorax sp. JHL-9 TaxID=1276756 RepID=UPI000400A143|nr:DUF3619 family protein [Acidovorax sp. JHL-9]